MSLKVVIPAPLRKYTSGAEIVETYAGTVQQIIDGLDKRFPGIRNSVCDEKGGLRRFINIYVDGEDVRRIRHSHDERGARAADGHAQVLASDLFGQQLEHVRRFEQLHPVCG